MRSFLGRHRFAVFVVVALALPLGAALTREMFAAGRCVERGGMYDYFRALCYMSAEQVFDEKGVGPLVWVSAWVAFKVGLVIAVAALPLRLRWSSAGMARYWRRWAGGAVAEG